MNVPRLTDLELLGYRLLIGAPVPPSVLSYNRVREALAAAQRHREFYEIDVGAMMRTAASAQADFEDAAARISRIIEAAE